MSIKLQKLVTWTDKCGLGVNPAKTKLILFSRKYKILSLIRPRIKDSVLSFSKSARYLGLILDRKWDWKTNTQDKCRKATIALYTTGKRVV